MAAPVPALSFIHEPRRAAALLDPLRLRLLERLREPDSATGLARQLRLPRQKVNYHLRALEKAGLVKLVEERRKGNCVERVMRATAVSYLIDPAALGKLALDPSQVRDRFSSAYLVALAARALRELAALRAGAEKASKKLATLSLETQVRFASAEARNAFAGELANAIADLTAKYHDEKAPGGRRFRFLLGAYPTPAKEEP